MIIIDYKDRRPIYEQIIERFQDLIVKGVLKPDSQLPSVRNLAMELSINPNTIQRAYMELERQGFIYSVKGRGNFVSPRENAEQNERICELKRNFKTCASELLYLGVTKEELIDILQKGENSCD